MDGWRELEKVSVFIKGSQLVVVGHPGDEDKVEHNCDEMGCGSADHVILRGFISKHGCMLKEELSCPSQCGICSKSISEGEYQKNNGFCEECTADLYDGSIDE